MENVLMRFCRRTHRYTPKKVATHLGISVEIYRDIETGDILLNEKQARQLGALYNVPYSYFYKEAQQLDLLLTRKAIIDMLKQKINILVEKSKKQAGTVAEVTFP
jgi:transcriptional regulator with XRE-family HTH domain